MFLIFWNTLYFTQSPFRDSNPTVHVMHYMWYIAVYFLIFWNTLYFTQSPFPWLEPYSLCYALYVIYCRVEDLSLSVVEWFKIISDFLLAFQEIYHHQLSVSDVMTMFRLRDMVRPIWCVCVRLLQERTVTLFCSLKFRARQPCAQLMDQCVFYVVWRWSLFRGLTVSLLSLRTQCNN